MYNFKRKSIGFFEFCWSRVSQNIGCRPGLDRLDWTIPLYKKKLINNNNNNKDHIGQRPQVIGFGANPKFSNLLFLKFTNKSYLERIPFQQLWFLS